MKTHPFELFLQLFPQGLGTVMKLVRQLAILFLESLQGPALSLNISPFLERQHTHTQDQCSIEEHKNRRKKKRLKFIACK